MPKQPRPITIAEAYWRLGILSLRNEPARETYESLALIREQVLEDTRLTEESAEGLMRFYTSLMAAADRRFSGVP